MNRRNVTGRIGDVTRMTCTESDLRVIRLHCDYLRRTGARPGTVESRRANLQRISRQLPGELLHVTAEHLELWQSGLTVAITSIATYTNHVVAFYRWAVEAGHLDIDPSVRLPRPKVPARSARPIPDADLKVALACAPEPMRTWLILAAFMGLRAMEVAQIRREDLSDISGRLVLSGIGKGGKPFRLPVPTWVEPSLRQHLTAQRGPLWLTARGRPVRASHVSHEVGRFFRSIGMPYTLHWCRHHFGTAAYRQTRDLLLTQDLMRHSNPSTTRLYVETTRAETTAAMDRLSVSLRPASAGRRGKPSRTERGEAA